MDHVENIKKLMKMRRLKEVKIIYTKNDIYYYLRFESKSSYYDISLEPLNKEYDIIGFGNIIGLGDLQTIIRVKPKKKD